MDIYKKQFEKKHSNSYQCRGLLFPLFFTIMSLAVTLVLAESTQRTHAQTLSGEEDRQNELNLLKRREIDRSRYAIEQKTVHEFSCEKKIDYSPYFSAYIYGVEVDVNQNKIFIISETGNLALDQAEIEEIKRRVLFMDQFGINMDRYYFPCSESKDLFNPHRFGWPEYKNVPYSPFSSVNGTDTHIFGFVNKPKTLRLISGTNFLEDGPYGKQTNPQPVFIDYEFGPMRNGSLQERNDARFNLLNEEFKKTRDVLDRSGYADRLRYINEACRITGKTKSDVTVLDIGCGLGMVLNMLRLNGYKKLYGIDMDSSKINVLQRACLENDANEITPALIDMNSDMIVEMIRQKCGQGLFDVILLHDTIEHIPNPRKTLHAINALLAKRGVLLFTGIPDVNSLAAHFEAAAYGDYDKFTHLNFFTKETIKTFANQEGFDVLLLQENDTESNSSWNFIFEECLPYVMNGKWLVLGRELPFGMSVRDVFPDNALAYNLYTFRPQDGKRMPVNFERYKLYEKYKEFIDLLFKKFFIETTNEKLSQNLLHEKIEDLKENLFNTVVLDTPTGISVQEKEQLALIRDAEAVRVKQLFQDIYQLSLRTRWCYFVRQVESPMAQTYFDTDFLNQVQK